MEGWGAVDLYQGVGGGDRGWVLPHSLFFLLVLLSFLLACPVSFFK